MADTISRCVSYLKPTFAAAIVCSLTNCASLSVLSYKKDEKSGVPGQTAAVYLISTPQAQSNNAIQFVGQEPPLSDAEIGVLGPKFADGLKSCGRAPELPFVGLLVPLVGFAVQQGLDAVVGALTDRATAIQEASNQSYNAHLIVIDVKEFEEKGQCLLVVRRGSAEDEASEGVGLVALFDLERQGASPDSFELRPLFLRMNNSVAWTAAGKPVTLAFAFVGRGARTTKESTNVVVTFADSTVRVPIVEFGKDRTGGAPTGLLALPPDDVTAVEWSVGVTEVGAGAPDAKRVNAEASALAKAIGPTLTTSIQGLLQPAPP